VIFSSFPPWHSREAAHACPAAATHLNLGAATVRNLEIFQNLTTGSATGSLMGIMDRTVTPFGRRLLRQWVSQPLLDVG